jgi:hypothetical protein
MKLMSDFIPKHPSVKLTGLGPKAQKLQALRDKAAAANAKATGTAVSSEPNTAIKAKNSFAGKKTAFQRKAT